MEYRIRGIREDEYEALKDFLYEAIFIPEGVSAFDKAIVEHPRLRIYIENFGKEDDRALVAEAEGKIIGAVWTRIIEDYGHLDDETPSLSISLYKEYRRLGIGTAMMKQMLLLLKEAGYKKVSLSVQQKNYAAKMYLALGFRIAVENEQDYIMVYNLDEG